MNKMSETLNTVQNKSKQISDQPNLQEKIISLESQLQTVKSSFKNINRMTKECLHLLQEAQELRIQLALAKEGRHTPRDNTPRDNDEDTALDNKDNPRRSPLKKNHPPHNMVISDNVNDERPDQNKTYTPGNVVDQGPEVEVTLHPSDDLFDQSKKDTKTRKGRKAT